MSSLDGVFELRNPRDLLQKLQFDYKRLNDADDPVSLEAQYAAFDFFTTGEHLADWQMKANPGTTLAQWRSYPDGALVHHIANGAKHFRVDGRHKTVRATGIHHGGFSKEFDRRDFDVSALVVDLENGKTEDVLDVAERVLEHWQATIK